MFEIEIFLEKFINTLNNYENNNIINERLKNLFTLINNSSEDFYIESIQVSKNTALALVVAELEFLSIYNNNNDKVNEVYCYIINGFLNFWHSPRYFNQEIINDFNNKGLCIPLNLQSSFINTYLNTNILPFLLECVGIEHKSGIFTFECEIIRDYLEDYLKNTYSNTIIKIDFSEL